MVAGHGHLPPFRGLLSSICREELRWAGPLQVETRDHLDMRTLSFSEVRCEHVLLKYLSFGVNVHGVQSKSSPSEWLFLGTTALAPEFLVDIHGRSEAKSAPKEFISFHIDAFSAS